MSQYHLLLESKKNDMNSFRAEIDSQKTNLWLPKGKEGANQEFGIKIYILVHINEMTNLLYSTGNYTQSLIITYNGIESKKEYICITESLCCILETNTTL